MEHYYKILFPYAYNIIGTFEDAQDVVQDVISGYINMTKSEIQNEKAYLIRSVINRSLNVKNNKSKMVRNHMWLPEPIATETSDQFLNREEILSYSLLVLLEKLTPKERAVFILKEAFDYSHDEIASVLSVTSESSRKLLSRSKEKLKGNSAISGKKTKIASEAYFKTYITAIQNGDMEALESLLTKDITLIADGGTEMKVVREITSGTKEVSDLLLYVYNVYQQNATIRIKNINGQSALCFYQDGALINCQVFEFDTTLKISRIYSVVDPVKLKNLHF